MLTPLALHLRDCFLKRLSKAKYILIARYLLVGIISLIANGVFFFTFSIFVFPIVLGYKTIYTILDLTPPVGLTVATTSRNMIINNVIAFLGGNLVSYIMNANWVFQSRQHHVFKEFFLFYAGASIAIAVGSGAMMISNHIFHLGIVVSYYISLLVAGISNFIIRKKVIF